MNPAWRIIGVKDAKDLKNNSLCALWFAHKRISYMFPDL
jgi:hypothetical protein